MDFQDLLDFLNELSPDSAQDPDVLAGSLGTYRDRLLQPLKYKGPSAEARAQVVSLRVATQRYGDQVLDAEPDRRMALQLSDELKLDEVLCVEFLIAAMEERCSFTSEAAAGLYLEERQAALRCLSALLMEVATGQLEQHAEAPPPARHPYGPVLQEFVHGMLAEKTTAVPGQEARQVLVSRIIELLQDNSLEAGPGSSLPAVVDEAGIAVPRAILLQLERRLLAKSLLYACVIDQRLTPATTAALLDLLHTLALRLRGTGANDPFQLEALQMVLLSTALVTSPQPERGASERADIMAIINHAGVRGKVEAGDVPQEGYSAVLRLSWGALLATAQQSPDDVKRHLTAATAAGAFQALRQVFDSSYFRGDQMEHQALVASVVYGLMAGYLHADQANQRLGLVKGLLARNLAAVRRVGNVITYAPLPPTDPTARQDHGGTLLALLAAVFTAYPRLWLYHEQLAEHRPAVEAFIATVVLHEVMRVSPEVRVPFLDMLSALACNDYGAALVMRQVAEMAKQPLLEVLTWKRLLIVLVEYCVRYTKLLNEDPAGQLGGRGAAGGGREEKLMNTFEADILVSFLTLLRNVLERGATLEVRQFLEQLEREVAPLAGGAPLYEPLVQLMCNPVPNNLKAALDSVLSALVRFPEYSMRLLERLMQCAAVSPFYGNTAADGNGGLAPGVPRLDLVTQLNEVEARREEYPETIAFIGLLNNLSEPLRAQPAGAGGAQELAPFTAFIMQHVLGHLWQRGYKDPAQKYELAAVSFTHLELMVELAGRSNLHAADVASRQAPGFMVMHSLLGGSVVLSAVMHVLSPGYGDLSALRSHLNLASPREAAVIAALRLLLALSRLDDRFLRDLQQAGINDRYQRLDAHFRRQPELCCLLEYVCYQDSVDIQVLSIQLGTVMSQRMPNVVLLLQGPNYDADRCLSVRRGYALALKHGLTALRAMDSLDEQELDALTADPGQRAGDPDPRAALILRLLLDSAAVDQRPNLTHLLMGYEVEVGDRSIERSTLVPKAEFSCLTVIERALGSRQCGLSRSKPRLYAQMLDLLYRLASQPHSDTPMLQYLSPRLSPDLVPQLACVLMQPLPPVEQIRELAAALQQTRHILKLQALLLLRLDHDDSVRGLLYQLFAQPPSLLVEDPVGAFVAGAAAGGQLGGGEGARDSERNALVELLELVCTASVQVVQQAGQQAGRRGYSDPPLTLGLGKEPHLSGHSPDERRLLVDLPSSNVSVADLLISPDVQSATGVMRVTDAGHRVGGAAVQQDRLVPGPQGEEVRCLLSRPDTSELGSLLCQATRVLLAKLQEQAGQQAGRGLGGSSEPLA